MSNQKTAQSNVIELTCIAVGEQDEGDQAYEVEMHDGHRTKALDQHEGPDNKEIDADDFQIQAAANQTLVRRCYRHGRRIEAHAAAFERVPDRRVEAKVVERTRDLLFAEDALIVDAPEKVSFLNSCTFAWAVVLQRREPVRRRLFESRSNRRRE